MAGDVFINYRRALNLKDAQLLQKALQHHFGQRGVFLDVSGLDGGDHWLHTLERQVDGSAAMVALVGRGWLGVTDEKGNRRLDNPNDFVRFELARAFSRSMPVLPVLIDGAELPDVVDLPTNLRPLTFLQAMHLRSESLDDDADKIARRLRYLIAQRRRRGPSYLSAGASAVAALAVGIAFGPMLLSRLGLPLPGVALSDDERLRADLNATRADLAKAARQRDVLRADLVASQKAVDAAKIAAAQSAAMLEAATKEREVAFAQAKRAKKEAAGAIQEAEQLRRRLDVAEARAKSSSPPTPSTVLLGCKGVELSVGTTGERLCIEPGSGKTRWFKDCPTCPEMVVVPAGSFLRGSPEGEDGRDKDEGPQQEVTIKAPFAVGRFAVTFSEWDECVAAGGCKGYRAPDEGWGRGRRPVINVSWEHANAYIEWISTTTGKSYRLLTEAEREYVTRAGEKKEPFWWGSSIDVSQANYDGNYTYGSGLKGEYRRRTLPVDSFEANPWGLYQVHGNVWDWVQDCWKASYHGAPTDGSAWTADPCDQRVLRGGSWNYSPRLLRAAYRGKNAEKHVSRTIGFRVARTPNP